MVETYVHKERAISRFIPTDSGSAVAGFCGDNTQAIHNQSALHKFIQQIFCFIFNVKLKR